MEYIIGVGVSLAVQWLKSRLGTNVVGTYLVVLVASFCAAAVYVYLVDTAIWPVVVQVLTISGAFYAFVLQRFETK